MKIRMTMLATVALLAAGAPAMAATVTIPGDNVFPESMSEAKDGTLYIGSIGQGAIWKVAPGAPPRRPSSSRTRSCAR